MKVTNHDYFKIFRLLSSRCNNIVFLFFFFHLIIALGDIIHDKLTKIIKKNKYVDKTVAIAVNLIFIVILLFGFCSIGHAVCRFIGL